MAADNDIRSVIAEAFGGCRRPEHFTDFTHCEECQEHDELLRSRDRESLTLADLGNPGWDPLCFTSAEGICYFMPALVRLVLSSPDDDWYFPQMLFHLTGEGARTGLLKYVTPLQREAVDAFLRHVAQTRQELVDNWGCDEDLEEARALWSGRRGRGQ